MSLPKSLNSAIKSYNPNKEIKLSTVPYADDYDGLKAMRDRAMAKTNTIQKKQSVANGLSMK